MQLNRSDEAYGKGKYDSSAAHTLKVAADKEKERLRCEVRNRKKAEKAKAEKAATAAALLQLNPPQAGLLQLPLIAPLAAPHPIPPPSLAPTSSRVTR